MPGPVRTPGPRARLRASGTTSREGGNDMEPVRPAPLTGPGEGTSGYVSKTDLVAALIRELIITGELAAGEQLRQRDLAQRFHVSQTPVREAMRRLESEGLVVGDTHRGFTVVEPDDQTLGFAGRLAGRAQDRRAGPGHAAGAE